MASESELLLLRASLSLEAPAPTQCGSDGGDFDLAALQRAVELIEQGQYQEVLAMEPFANMFEKKKPEAHSDPYVVGGDIYDRIAQKATSFCCGDEVRETLVVAGGVASLFIFMQANFTGPQVKFPAFPMHVAWDDETPPEEAWDVWARGKLMLDGCDMIGKCYAPQYLLLARSFLGGTSEQRGPSTRIWWASRALMAQQRVLEHRSPTLSEHLKLGYSEVVRAFGATTSMEDCSWYGALSPGEGDTIAALAYLEAAQMEYYYRHDDASAYLELAESFSGLKYSLEGALGYWRRFQEEPQAVLVLRDEADLPVLEETTKEQDESDTFQTPRLQNQSDSLLHRKVLTPVQQSVLLSRCLDIKRATHEDEFRSSKMAPYIETVEAQDAPLFMVGVSCRLYRVERENYREKTLRSIMKMEAIVADVREGSAHVSDRMRNVFCLPFPCIQALLKDYANMLVKVGNVGEALKLFEELELWYSLIDCHNRLGDKARAASLIQERLQVSPKDPRLWLGLYHATNDDSCLLKSWEVSNQKFAPAQRCLAVSACNSKNYLKAIGHWKLALSLNHLDPYGWFSLGFSALKVGETDTAMEAFVRTVQVEPDHGEAWNNLGSLHLRKGNFKEAKLAFEEATKFMRSSWHLWDNLAHVCFKTGAYSQAVFALEQVFQLSPENFRLPVLAKLVEVLGDELGADSGKLPMTPPAHQLEHFAQILGRLLSKVALSGKFGGEIWGLKARWHEFVGESDMCLEALVKQVRAFQGSDWQHDKAKFQRLAAALVRLSEACINTGTKRDLYSTRLLLGSTLKQAGDFENMEEYKALQMMVQDLECKTQQNG